MHAKALAVVFLLVATGITAIVTAPPAQGATRINGQLVEESGPTSALGGGDHVFVRFGTDAAFGVVYGTTANPNNIYLVAIKARYLGVAQVVDQGGRSVAENRSIKIYTLYAVKLDSLVEFRDLNGNSIADYARVYNATTHRFSNYINRGDTLYKKVDLNTNWTASPVVRTNDTSNRSWTFNLTAQNLPYTAVANYSGTVTGTLPMVRFTFHLNASLDQVNNTMVPQWQVMVGTVGGRTVVTNISRMADLTVSGNVVHYNLKWDQEITGWTFEPGNTAGNAHRVLLEVGAIVGNWIPAALVDAWFETRVMDRMGETGTAQFTTAAGAQTSNESSGTYAAARRLQNPAVDFGGNWTRIARLEWVGTSVVDGVNRAVFGQIVAGLRFATLHDGNLFAGFVLLAGLSFRGGATIVHDPTVSSDVQADLALPGTTPTGPGPIFLAAVGAVVVIAALLAIAFLVRKRRKKDELPPPPPDE